MINYKFYCWYIKLSFEVTSICVASSVLIRDSSFQTQCGEQESELRRLSGRLEELNEARSEQARQLAEARLRVQSAANKERRGEGERSRELRQLQEQLAQARDTAQQVRQTHLRLFVALLKYLYALLYITVQYVSNSSPEANVRYRSW